MNEVQKLAMERAIDDRKILGMRHLYFRWMEKHFWKSQENMQKIISCALEGRHIPYKLILEA